MHPNATRKHPLAECERCPLYETGTFVPSSIPTQPSNGLAFIGESPGTQEKKKGRPFIGPSGQLLDEVLDAHGIKRNQSLLTNGALCNYQDEDKASLPGAIEACRPRLLSELSESNIQTAVTLGNAAAKSLLDTKIGITKLRGGEPKSSDYAPVNVIPTFHPAFCLRDQGKFPLMLSDIGKIKPKESTWIEPTIHVITDSDKALRVLRGANTQYPIVLDVETGKEKEEQYSRTTNLLCIGLGTTNPNHANRVVVIGRPAMDDPKVRDALITLVSKTGVICQNGKFDCYILHTINEDDFPIYLSSDTMLMSYSLNENPGTHGLKYMGVEYLGTPHWEDEIKPYLKAPKDPPEIRQPALEHVRHAFDFGPELRTRVLKSAPDGINEAAIKRAADELGVEEYKQGSRIYWYLDPEKENLVAPPEADGSYSSIPPSILHKYNAYDVQVTRQLHDYFSTLQAEEGLTEFNQHLMVMSNALMRVERNGLHLDYEFNATLHQQFTEFIEKLAHIFPDSLNPNSWQQLLKFIKEQYGYELTSTGEEVITGYVHDPKTSEPFRQFCTELLEYRRWTKLRSTYVTSIRKLAIENSGRVLPTFKIDQATTGRLASKNPNVQNMPRQFDIKRQFIPSTSDRVFVHADYSQLELRVITWLAQDESMRALFNDPERDVFDELALYVYGYTKEQWLELKRTDPKAAKEMRVVVKSFAYGIAYGRTPQGIAADPDLDISVEEAVARYKIFSEQIPTILAFQKSIIRRIHRGEDLVNVFGRRRRFHLITNQNKHDLEKQAMAYLPQSTASDICVTALSRLPDYFDPRNIIHDAILIEAPREEAEEQGQILVKTMIDTAEEITGGYVKFDVDYDIGETWADV